MLPIVLTIITLHFDFCVLELDFVTTKATSQLLMLPLLVCIFLAIMGVKVSLRFGNLPLVDLDFSTCYVDMLTFHLCSSDILILDL